MPLQQLLSAAGQVQRVRTARSPPLVALQPTIKAILQPPQLLSCRAAIRDRRLGLRGLVLACITGTQLARQFGILGLQRCPAFGQRFHVRPIGPVANRKLFPFGLQCGQHLLPVSGVQRLAAEWASGGLGYTQHGQFVFQRLALNFGAIVFGLQGAKAFRGRMQFAIQHVPARLELAKVGQRLLRLGQHCPLFLAYGNAPVEVLQMATQLPLLRLQPRTCLPNGETHAVHLLLKSRMCKQPRIPFGILLPRPLQGRPTGFDLGALRQYTFEFGQAGLCRTRIGPERHVRSRSSRPSRFRKSCNWRSLSSRLCTACRARACSAFRRSGSPRQLSVLWRAPSPTAPHTLGGDPAHDRYRRLRPGCARPGPCTRASSLARSS